MSMELEKQRKKLRRVLWKKYFGIIFSGTISGCFIFYVVFWPIIKDWGYSKVTEDSPSLQAEPITFGTPEGNKIFFKDTNASGYFDKVSFLVLMPGSWFIFLVTKPSSADGKAQLLKFGITLYDNGEHGPLISIDIENDEFVNVDVLVTKVESGVLITAEGLWPVKKVIFHDIKNPNKELAIDELSGMSQSDL